MKYILPIVTIAALLLVGKLLVHVLVKTEIRYLGGLILAVIV